MDLSYNGLQSLQPAQLFLRLRQLDLSWNLLADVSSLRHLPMLRSLCLNGNPLSSPLYFARGVTSLELQRCGLDSVPEGIGEMPDLCRLDVSMNRIRQLPKEISTLRRLEHLDISQNPLTDLQPLLTLPLKQLSIDARTHDRCSEVIGELKARGCRISTQSFTDTFGNIPKVHLEVLNKNTDEVLRLIAEGAEWKTLIGYPEYSVLDLACHTADRSVINAIIEAGANPLRSPSTRYQTTPLHAACEYHHALCHDPAVDSARCEAIEALLDARADVNARDWAGMTPLHRAATFGTYSAWGRSDLVRTLILRGAEIDAVDRRGKTPLHHAICNRDIQTCLTLLELGADPQGIEVMGILPLHLAARYGASLFCRRLLDAGAGIDNAAAQGVGVLHAVTTPPDRVARPRSRIDETIAFLVCRGASLEFRNDEGDTPLHKAALQNDAKVLRLLLSHGADPAAKNHKGETPLHIATTEENSVVIKELLIAGADVNAADHRRDTPLHLACRLGIGSVCRRLIRWGASLDTPNRDGERPKDMASSKSLDLFAALRFPPLHLAAWQDKVRRAQYLIERGHEVNTQDENGRSPLFYVNTKRMALFLLSENARTDLTDKDGLSPASALRKRRRIPAASVLETKS